MISVIVNTYTQVQNGTTVDGLMFGRNVLNEFLTPTTSPLLHSLGYLQPPRTEQRPGSLILI
jgi:hypothetical protein